MRKAKIKAIATTPFGESCNIIPASDYRPDWWKKQKPYFRQPYQNQDIQATEYRSIKACPAIHTQYEAGYIVTAPCNIEIIADSNRIDVIISEPIMQAFEAQYGGEEGAAGIFNNHPHAQFEALDVNDYVPNTLKINLGIQLVSETPMNVMFLNPYWTHIENSLNMVCMNGTMQLSDDIYKAGVGHGIIPNWLVKKNSKIVIKKGDPILQFVPFVQQNVELQEFMLTPQQKGMFKNYEYAVRTMTQVTKAIRFKTMLKHLMFKNGYTKSKENGEAARWINKIEKAIGKLKGFDDSDYTK